MQKLEKATPQEYLSLFPLPLPESGAILCEDRTHVIRIERTNDKGELGGYCYTCKHMFTWIPPIE